MNTSTIPDSEENVGQRTCRIGLAQTVEDSTACTAVMYMSSVVRKGCCGHCISTILLIIIITFINPA